jgi:hypothetical protein
MNVLQSVLCFNTCTGKPQLLYNNTRYISSSIFVQTLGLYLVQLWFQPSLGGVSVCILAYSMGTPSQIPFFCIATL